DSGLGLSRFYKLAVFAPVVTDWVATGLAWQLIFLPNQGVLAGLFEGVGLSQWSSLRWTSTRQLAPLAVAIFVVWKMTGLYTMVFLAGLRSVPREFQEAALMDGASATQVFSRITMPLLRPITVFVVVSGFVTVIGLFDLSESALMVVCVLDLLPAAIAVDGVCGAHTAVGWPHRADPVEPPSLATAELPAGAPGAPFCRRKSGAIHGEQRDGRRHHDDGLNSALHDRRLWLRQVPASVPGHPAVGHAVDNAPSIFIRDHSAVLDRPPPAHDRLAVGAGDSFRADRSEHLSGPAVHHHGSGRVAGCRPGRWGRRNADLPQVGLPAARTGDRDVGHHHISDIVEPVSLAARRAVLAGEVHAASGALPDGTGLDLLGRLSSLDGGRRAGGPPAAGG